MGEALHLGDVAGGVGLGRDRRRGEAVERPAAGLGPGDLGDVAGDRERLGRDRPGAERAIDPGRGVAIGHQVQADGQDQRRGRRQADGEAPSRSRGDRPREFVGDRLEDPRPKLGRRASGRQRGEASLHVVVHRSLLDKTSRIRPRAA